MRCGRLTAIQVVCAGERSDPSGTPRRRFEPPTVTAWVGFYLARILGSPVATSVVVTFEMANESAVPCNAPYAISLARWEQSERS